MTGEHGARPNPYVGPRFFEKGETLYGRHRELRELLDLLIAERIVLQYSPSGAGKTSLIRAALIPALEKEGFRVLPVMRVGTEPPSSVRQTQAGFNRYVLSSLLALEEGRTPAEQASLTELAGMRLIEYLGDAKSNEVLIFDQFEEILTVDPTDREAKEAFFAQVGEVLRERKRWALFAMREEYMPGLEPYVRPIPTRFGNTYRLDLLEDEAARDAIQLPSRHAGVDFTDDAAKKLVDDLRRVRVQGPDGVTQDQPGLYVEPVQLQVVCRGLWEKLQKKSAGDAPPIVPADVEAVGDVDTALGSYYAEKVKTIAAATGTSERSIREWFDRQLITEQGIRSQVMKGGETSQGLNNHVIEALEDAHLVRGEKRRGVTWFELAHDRMIEPVRRDNGEWFKANLSLLERQAAIWGSQNRPGGLLLRDQALADAERWAGEHRAELTPVEEDFLAACVDARRAAMRERRKNRVIQGLGLGAFILALIAFYAGLRAMVEETVAKRQALTATALRLAADSRKQPGDQYDRALLLAVESTRVSAGSTSPWEDLVSRFLPPDASAVDSAETTNSLLETLRSSSLPAHAVTVWSLAFSPDGKMLASGSDDGKIILWDVGTRSRMVKPLAGPPGRVSSLAFSRAGMLASATSEDKNIILWDVEKRTPVGQPLTGHKEMVTSVAFSPDGETLASSSLDGKIILWDVGTHRPLGPPLGDHKGPVWSVAFSPDGKMLASAGRDKNIILWDVGTHRPLGPPLTGRSDMVPAVAFSPDGKMLASGSDTGTITLWDVGTRRPLAPPLTGQKGFVRSVAFSRDGKILASGGRDHVIILWDVATHRQVSSLTGHTDMVPVIAFSPDGKTLASGSWDHTIILWDVGARRPADSLTDSLTGHHDMVLSVAFSPKGETLASGGRDNAIILWDAATHKQVGFLTGHTNSVLSVAFSPDGKKLASGSWDHTIILWDLGTRRPLGPPLIGHTGPVWSVAFSPDGKTLASGSEDQSIILWDAGTRKPIGQPLHAHTDSVLSVAFSPDGKMLASGSASGTIILWEVGTRRLLGPPLAGHTGLVKSVAFSRDGKMLASGSGDRSIILWDVGTRKPIGQPLDAHTDTVWSVAFSPDGKMLASGSGDKTIILWDVSTREPVGTLTGHTKMVWSVAFSPDEKTLASGGGDRTVMMWDVGLKSLQDRACRIANRNLTFDEWKQYMSAEPYRLTCPELPVDPGFIKAGRDLAEDGDIDGAVRIFKRAKELDSHSDLDPIREATKWKFFGEGLNWAKRGDVEDAVKLFRAADELDPSLVPDPIPYANKLAASSQVAEGKRLITLGEVKGALAAYAQANKFDSAEISAESWNELCWFGSLWGYAHDVMDACEQAVSHDRGNGLIRDSRGLARALTGNVDGAIEDFQALIAWADKQPNSERLAGSRERRAHWIDALRQGVNPFTPEELELLKRE